MLNMPERVRRQLRKLFDSLTKGQPQYYQREYRPMQGKHRWILYRQGVMVATVWADWDKKGNLTFLKMTPGPGMKEEEQDV